MITIGGGNEEVPGAYAGCDCDPGGFKRGWRPKIGSTQTKGSATKPMCSDWPAASES